MPEGREADATRPQPVVDGGVVIAEIEAIDPRSTDITREERTARQAVMEVKARALADALPDGFTVTVGRRSHSVSNVRYDETRNALVCEVSGLPEGANPLVFVNPPVLVGDGTFTENEKGRVENLVEDPARAFRTIVTQTVEHVT